MTLAVTSVSLADFRSFEKFELETSPSLTLLVGPNAVGKTNLVEAVQILTTGESFRRPQWADVVRWGADRAILSVVAEGPNRAVDARMEITAAGRRTYSVNGKNKRRVAGNGAIPCVIFTPEDLRLVKDSAERRRSGLDALGCQLSPAYSSLKSEYERIVRQRNALLKDDGADLNQLEVWTERLVAKGAALYGHRQRLSERVFAAMTEAYAGLADDGRLEATYIPSWERDGIHEEGHAEASLRRHLLLKSREEAARGVTLSGPHRDEIVFTIDGRDARSFASQGQQRTVALSWKLAEVAVVTEIAGQRPLLLLDDVMSELDERRRHALAGMAGESAQTIVTTTNLSYFDRSLLDRARVVNIG